MPVPLAFSDLRRFSGTMKDRRHILSPAFAAFSSFRISLNTTGKSLWP
jgi:hypothetical protein